MEDSFQSPPEAKDTSFLRARACRCESSLANKLLPGVLEESFRIIPTEPI